MAANPPFDSVIPNVTTAAAAPEKVKTEFTNPLYNEEGSLGKSFVVLFVRIYKRWSPAHPDPW